MNETLNWEDVRLFLAVARAGGLARAVAPTKLSAPTLGRRMTALERHLGVSLFERRRDGYDLTHAGRELFPRAEALERRALAIEQWQAGIDPLPVVKIAAGAWTGAFLARHGLDIVGGDDALRIEIMTGASLADLSRREANLGIRNRRPDMPGLAGRRLGRVEFAVYGAADLVHGSPTAMDFRRFGHRPWVAFSPRGTAVPSASWLEQRLERPARLRCSSPQLVVDAAIAGVGLCVLPCFIGDAEPRLTRASDTIPEIGHEQWLVSHDDDRHSPPIRHVLDRLFQLFRSHARLRSGMIESQP